MKRSLEYIARPPLSLKKIIIEKNGDGTVISFTTDNEFFKGKTETFPMMRLYASRTKRKWPDKPHGVRLADADSCRDHSSRRRSARSGGAW